MGMLIEGRWAEDADRSIRNGAFVRAESSFDEDLPAEIVEALSEPSGRFVLVASLSCPWSHRTLLTRALKGIGEVLPVCVAGGPRVQGYALRGDGLLRRPSRRPLAHLHQLYTLSNPAYTGRSTVPLLWDRAGQRIVSNGSARIMRGLDAVRPGQGYTLVPDALRRDIDALNECVYGQLSNAVYRAGLAERQEAYDEAVGQVFDTLDGLERRLSTRRYLLGPVVTEADWRLFPTLVRFDAVYATHFRCVRRRLVDYPALWAYARDLFAWRGVAGTVDFAAILEGYYLNDGVRNPHGIVAELPAADWHAPHGRAALGPAQVWSRSRGPVEVDPATFAPDGT